MSEDIVDYMVNASYNDYIYTVDFYKIGRGCGDNEGLKTNELKCWKIIDKTLEEIPSNLIGIFSDSETYIVKWSFEFSAEGEILKETVFFFWKGQHATKGYSPLPPEFENEQTIVERIVQWSEPPVFFRMFSQPVVIYSGCGNEFNLSKPHLFMFRGEFEEELHLFEVPNHYENLRSKTSYLLVDPQEKKLTYWHGRQTLNLYKNSKFDKSLLHIIPDLERYSITTTSEGELSAIKGHINYFLSIKNSLPQAPKLFYFNSITGDFMAILVEYSMASKTTTAPFPFLYSHLYTAPPPANFLIDNYSEIWLWTNSNETNEEFTKSKEISIKYCQRVKQKRNLDIVQLKLVVSGKEPLAFTNLFPYWTQRKAEPLEEWQDIPI